MPVQGIQPAKAELDQFAEEGLSAADLQQIRQAVKGKYAEVARSAEGKFGYTTGVEGAEALGYDAALLQKIPDNLLASFCGVGNPFAMEPLSEGEAVLDIGCGAGFDLIVARHLVGHKGYVCGVDLTPEMLAKADSVFTSLDIEGPELRLIEGEQLPFADNTFDIVISNGVINLSPRKLALFQEVHRVLKPGGRLQFADIVLDGELPSDMRASVDNWAQ